MIIFARRRHIEHDHDHAWSNDDDPQAPVELRAALQRLATADDALLQPDAAAAARYRCARPLALVRPMLSLSHETS